MDNWKPPLGNNWISATSTKRYNEWLNLGYSELVQQIESMLATKTGGVQMDDWFDWIERWIREKLRIWSGGDVSEFVVINSHIMTGEWRTDYYLQDIFHVICNDVAIQDYLIQLPHYPTNEQVARISNFLHEHPALKKSRFTHRGAWGPMATLIYRMGLDKILICK